MLNIASCKTNPLITKVSNIVLKMSARVFNPVLVSELKHGRTPGAERKINFTNRNFAALSPISRDLFGPVDHEECKKVLERELEKQHNQNMEHWEFDFINEVPRPGKGRYIWEATFEKINIRPIKRDYIENHSDISHLYHVPLEDVSEKEVKKSFHINTKQAKITDFLKVAKDQSHQSKLSQMKKVISTPSPRIGKIARRLKI